jgi:hypothetical protein
MGRKTLVLTLAVLTAFALSPKHGQAQSTGHSVTLTWTAGSDDTGFNVYRASGTCPTSPTTPWTGFTKITSITSATIVTYADTTVTVGQWCYFVTGTAGGAESVASNTVNPSVPPFPVSGLTAVVK